MALLIDNPETLQRITERAGATGLSADQVIAEALNDRVGKAASGALTGGRKAAAILASRSVQETFQKHRDPEDHRVVDYRL